MKGKRKGMNIRDNKGITLMAEVITVLILLMIISIISYSSMSSLQVRNLNNMYSDIVNIQEKAANYYLKYKQAPVTTEAVPSSVIDSIATEKNLNDEEGKYYKINFSALNMSLNNKQTTDNYYFMNATSLTVYYSKGVTIDNLNGTSSTKVFHTLPSNYDGVSKLNVGNYQN